MKLSIDIEIHHFMVSGERVCLSVTCLQRGGVKKKKKRKKEKNIKKVVVVMGLGLGWAFFLASLSSLEVECLSPPSPPLLRAAGPRSGNKKQDSITGR